LDAFKQHGFDDDTLIAQGFFHYIKNYRPILGFYPQSRVHLPGDFS
jgi:hypothetical protein